MAPFRGLLAYDRSTTQLGLNKHQVQCLLRKMYLYLTTRVQIILILTSFSEVSKVLVNVYFLVLILHFEVVVVCMKVLESGVVKMSRWVVVFRLRPGVVSVVTGG